MIHESAIISNKAIIDPSVEIGPYCFIGDNVQLSKNNKLISHVSIVGHTSIGENNTFYPFTSIGSIPQDLKYKGEKSYLIVGNDNIFRENVTVNPGTEGGGFKTVIENKCLFMVGSHVAHDCLIKSNAILANNATLAGHVIIFENVVIGGNSAIHQFVQIGKFSMIGGMSGVGKNIIPYSLYTGTRNDVELRVNIIGLKRKGLNSSKINNITKTFKLIFDQSNSIENNVDKLPHELKNINEVFEIIEFIKNNKKRGLYRYNND